MRDALSYVSAALARSASARPDLLVTSSGELLNQLNSIVEQLYVDAAQANPPTFPGEAEVSFTSGTPAGIGTFAVGTPAGWWLPSDCIRVYRVEVTGQTVGVNLVDWPDGSEVAVVQLHHRTANFYQPAVVDSGRVLLTTGGTPNQPTGGSLRLKYGGRPVPMGGLSALMDSRWLGQHDELVELLLAAYCAVKDGRGSDAGEFTREAGEHYARYLAALDSPVAVTKEIMQRFRRNLLTAAAG